MKFHNGYKILLSVLVLIFASANFACEKKAQSPTAAYKMLYAAVKAKDTEKIKAVMSKNSLGLAEVMASRYNQTTEKSLENGFLETTFADALPQMRDERVKGNFGAVEVYNEKSKRWDDTNFILEDGAWKLAVGDVFKGSYQSPGKGEAQIEAEKNNPMNDANLAAPNTNGAFPMNNSAPTNANSNGKKGKVETAEVPIENANKKSVADKEKK